MIFSNSAATEPEDGKTLSVIDGVIYKKLGLIKNMRIILKHLICSFLILLWTERIFADYTLPDGLQHIETEAFAGDVSLTNVIIPSTVTSIGARAFAESSLVYLKYSTAFIPLLGFYTVV